MLIFKKQKLIQSSKSEYEMIRKLYLESSCFNEAQEKLFKLFLNRQIEYKELVDRGSLLYEMSYNALMACINNYKYLKVGI